MTKQTEKKYKIGEVAEILGVHEDTLRNWEREGFVVPERIGKRKDRRYTAEMIGEIRKKGLISDLAKKAPASKKDLNEYTKDELIKELQILKKQKKYGLVWEDHTEEVVERCKTEAPILVAKKDKQIKDKNKNKPTNILIEGDNYHALQVLNYTHKGKIDVIYIDPPYNTGNKDFIYNDHYVDKEDNFRHSKWLSFMEKRLVFAKKLLKKDGVIFVSIDDNEVAQLKILSDGIFGEENFVDCVVWDKKSSPKGVPPKNMIVNVHEYILIYQKSNKFSFLGEPRKDDDFKNPDSDPRGTWRNTNIKSTIKNKEQSFSITDPKTGNTFTDTWAFSKKELDRLIKEKYIIFPKNKKGQVRKKEFFNEFKNQNIPLKSSWGLYDNQKNTEMVKNILGSSVFLNPKPLNLIKYIIKSSFHKNSVILDFMTGSGTTGHAVLDLNKEDGGNRKFILCTNNELNGLEKELREKGMSEEEIEEHGICRRITHKRIEKVMKGYTTPKGKKVKGLGGSLEYFKTEFVDVENIEKVSDKKKLEFTYEAGQMIALKEDAFKEVVKNKFYQIFTDEKDKFVGIYFRENLDKLAEMEKKILDKKDVKLYLFSYGVNDFKKDYAEYKNVTVKDIPEPILKIYKRLNN
ncbi:MAG TPA: MerR family transcriptional regulator [Ignavibacteria bacterium]|nr:MerR family transcriptional regulator [Ignavibacteria bacterium]